MTFTANARAESGKWTDWTTGRTSLVVDATLGYVLIAFAGIWLSLSVKYIKKILANVALLALLWRHTDSQVQDAEDEQIPLARPEVASTKDAQSLARIFRETSGVRDLFAESLSDDSLSWSYRIWLFVFTSVVSVAALGMIVGGILSAKVKSEGPAKLASRQCGLWLFDEIHGSEQQAALASVLDLEKETRAGDYARDCYSPVKAPMSSSTSKCNFFYQPTIHFEGPIYNNECPFNQTICRKGPTVSFRTDFTDSGQLGLNSQHAPKFRRHTTCSALSIDFPFVTNVTENGTTTYFYHYGDKPGHDPYLPYTYKTVGDPYDRLAPVYDVFAYTTSSTGEYSYWTPSAELRHEGQETSTLTIVFVQALRILYKQSSEDPIFPANEAVIVPDHEDPLYRNSDPRARPFACIDHTEVCLADGETCWPFDGPSPDDVDTDASFSPEFWMMYASLLKTNIFYSMIKRLGRALIAQDLVAEYISEGLDRNHWVAEVKSLVETIHARAQMNAWNIASGEDSVHEGEDGYYQASNPAEMGDFCHRYKFFPAGYVSIHFAAFVTICCATPCLWLLGLDWPPIGKFIETQSSKLWRAIESSRIGQTLELNTDDSSRSRAEAQATGTTSSRPEPSSSAAPNRTSTSTYGTIDNYAGHPQARTEASIEWEHIVLTKLFIQPLFIVTYHVLHIPYWLLLGLALAYSRLRVYLSSMPQQDGQTS